MGGVAFVVSRHEGLLRRAETPAYGHEGPLVRWPCGDMKRALWPSAFNGSHPSRRLANLPYLT
jgi:hypothetical protein